MEAKAIKRYIPTSPRKMRIVADLVRGKTVDHAINILHFTPNHASKFIEKTLRSAVANLSNKVEKGKIDEKEVFIQKISVDVGPTLKRMRPAPRGRPLRIRKRSNHLTIVVAEIEEI